MKSAKIQRKALAMDKDARIGLLGELWNSLYGPGAPKAAPDTFDEQESDKKQALNVDPIPNLTELGGIPLNKRDKWYLNEALYLVGCLAREGAIAFVERPGISGNSQGENIMAAVRILSRAMFNLEYEIPLDDLDSRHAEDK